ncbi:hypothetical protein C9I98_05450 [Photobacterium sanctipauli]|uniref:Uncharacterized protein n=1 Tax=Photobacterium sanctipauli TaxID=1342794 RepID=A0A2T3NYN6_9GAMM|nr:hypothetical protein [Photobacterium sanctipauli]PSW21381.1 hypothetical protein C9I98_05450 [Photobacterium sanctipauli]
MTYTLNVLGFPMAEDAPSQAYPENQLDDFPSDLQQNIGVAFSGGGTRSACCTLGQLKALHDTGILPKVKYISSVSGGTWASVPFLFLPANKIGNYFSGVKNPDQIDLTSGKEIRRHCFQYCLTHATVVDKLLKAAFNGKGDESFAEVIGKTFLAPFGLHDSNKYFTYSNTTLEEALERNPEIVSAGILGPNDFFTQRAGTPYMIVGATLLNHDGIEFKKKYPVEYTAYYSGIRTFFEDKDFFSKDDYFGGGYIESLGYDCIGPRREYQQSNKPVFTVKRPGKGFFDWTPERAFSLSDIMASSGAAPQEFTNTIGLGALGFPEFYHIPMRTEAGAAKVAEEYPHSDGGHMENLGIMPLLAREVTRIYVFINTKCVYYPQKNWQPNMAENNVDIEDTNINKSVKGLFVPLKNWFGLSKFDDNLVFHDGANKLKELITAFNTQVTVEGNRRTCYAKEGLVFTQQLVTKANSLFSVPDGLQVEVTWVYNQRSKTWEDALKDQAIAEEIRQQRSDHQHYDPLNLSNFPHYETFLENGPVINLQPLQTNLLSSHAYYVATNAFAVN